MHLKNVLLFSALSCASFLPSNAQTFVPPNMDFELGTTANWTFYRGKVATGHVFSITATPAVTGLHTLTSGTGTDAYAGFPVVGHGLYSLKLSHDTIDNNADAASYNIHVPAGGSYSLNYYYAAVLQDTVHAPNNQPVMKVTAIDSATGMVLSDSLDITPVSPGFTMVTGTDIFYKPWTSASINLTGYGGHTVIVKFEVGSCGTGAHFGYGYIDVGNVFYLPSLGTPSITGTANGTINIYPNPTSGMLNIQWANQQTGFAELDITDVTGRIVGKSKLNLDVKSGTTQMNIGGLDDGVYVVNIRSASINYSDKIVIQK